MKPFRYAFAAIALVGLAACASNPSGNSNPALQDVFTAESTYDAVVLLPASTYWNLPPCPAVPGAPCADPTVAAQLRQADAAVATAFAAAEAIARTNPGADPLTLLADVVTAQTAIEKILTSYGIKWGTS